MSMLVDEEMMVSEKVAEHVRHLIVRKELRSGALLPSYRELADELGVAVRTAKRGMDRLASQGIVRRQVGQGCFVKRELTPQGRPLKTVGIIHIASQKHLFTAPYLTQIMQGINGGQQPLNIHIFTLQVQGLVTATQFSEHHIDGVVLLGVENDAYLREFATWGVPGVVADYVTEGIPLDFVACDNPSAVQRAVRHLVGLGHRHIWYVGGHPDLFEPVAGGSGLATRSSDLMERREAVIGALKASPGIRWGETIVPRGVQGVGIIPECARRWRQDPGRPTAFVTDGEQMAESLIRQLTQEGFSVPGDVSVCTVAMAGPVMIGSLALTGARYDFVGMGCKAVELLRRRCEEPEAAAAPAVYRVGFEWVEGSTCGACA